MSSGSLGEQLKKEIDLLFKEINEVTKDVARSVMKEVVENTVIDTSQAVSNWELQLDTPNKQFVSAHFVGKAGSTAIASERETLSIAERNLAGRKLEEPIFITNNIKGSEGYDYNSQVLIAEEVAVQSAEQAVLIAESKFRNR
jgi:hypothetical protein